MISGVEHFNLNKMVKRLTKLWIWVLFYTWIILLIHFCFRIGREVTTKEILHNVFPLIFNEYWFVTSFFVLFLLTPLLNKMIAMLKKKQLLAYLVILTVVTGAMPLLNGVLPPFGSAESVGIMITSYLFAAYSHKYDLRINNLLLILLIIICLGVEYLFKRFNAGIMPFLVVAAIFILVTRMKSYHSVLVNAIASSVFASYLITENELIRFTLWHKWLNVGQYTNHPILPGLVIALCLLFITIISDQLYKLIYFIVINRFKDKLDKYLIAKISVLLS